MLYAPNTRDHQTGTVRVTLVLLRPPWSKSGRLSEWHMRQKFRGVHSCHGRRVSADRDPITVP